MVRMRKATTRLMTTRLIVNSPRHADRQPIAPVSLVEDHSEKLTFRGTAKCASASYQRTHRSNTSGKLGSGGSPAKRASSSAANHTGIVNARACDTAWLAQINANPVPDAQEGNAQRPEPLRLPRKPGCAPGTG